MASVSSLEPNLLVLGGEIDLHESPQVKQGINQLLKHRPPRVYIDLSRVTYIDSSGLATLIEAMQQINAYGGHLALFGIHDTVAAIFHIAQLDQVFRIFPDQVAAREALEGR
jgi:anti-sigma B factor antagonist